VNFSKILKLLIPCLIITSISAADKTAPPPTYTDVKYGKEERQVLDFWKADSKTPTPVVVLIHGGGWIHGDKKQEAKIQRNLIRYMLKNGVSIAAINYRFVPKYKLPVPVYDAARAVQFLRYKAKDWNIDKQHIAATGGSAGGCTSLWLATHGDMADPGSSDSVLRESTRLCGASVGDAQTTIDPVQIREWKNDDALKHCMIKWSLAFKSNKDMDANYESVKAVYKEFSPVNHLDKNDPPMLLRYSKPLDHPTGIHHALFGYHFKKKADEVGAPVTLEIRHKLKKGEKPVNPYVFLLDTLKPDSK
jgi:hypothetical protein